MIDDRGHLGSLSHKKIFYNPKWISTVLPVNRVLSKSFRVELVHSSRNILFRGISFCEISKAAFEKRRENKLYGKMKQS